jgi:signal transduction histidine kinase
MEIAAREPAVAQGAKRRWALAYVWVVGLGVYCAAVFVGSERAAMWINDGAWTLASTCAAFACFRAAGQVEYTRRRAWLLLGIASTSWLIGQLHWNYSQLVLHVELPFPSIGQIFFSGFAVLAIVAFLQFPECRQPTPFTLRHVGNIGLVSCCLAVAVVLGMLEPALQIRVPAFYLWIGLAHTVLVAATFLTALYALWTYRWGSSWMPMLLLVIGAGIYAVSNLIYAHSLLVDSYLPGDLINVSWLVMFGLITSAAAEQTWLSTQGHSEPPQRMQARERWLEAVVPALLIVIMVVVAVSSAATLTPRVIAWAAALFIMFAVILGGREAWIQNESQQLTGKLMVTNEQLQSTNAELRLSQSRYRELTTALEQRVGERTIELKRAYDELEGFSYAVAHDLKAPLRAINGFAHLLELEISGQLSDRARQHLGRIRNGSLKMAALIDDLLSYSQIDRRSVQANLIGLPGLVDSAVVQFADELQRRCVELSIDVEPIRLRVDADGLSLALRNLFENALKYTREAQPPRIEIVGRKSDTGVLLEVRDNGIGFDMQYHEHIFKIFQRLHRDDQYPGTGIGLALVRKAVERVGGTVWAQSAAGEGATFYVELPRGVLV